MGNIAETFRTILLLILRRTAYSSVSMFPAKKKYKKGTYHIDEVPLHASRGTVENFDSVLHDSFGDILCNNSKTKVRNAKRHVRRSLFRGERLVASVRPCF
jgi:hypothetical protein